VIPKVDRFLNLSTFEIFLSRMAPLKTKFSIAGDDADDAGLFAKPVCQIDKSLYKCFKVKSGRDAFDFLSDSGSELSQHQFLKSNCPLGYYDRR
jgi:hypothetical protein